MEFIINSVSDKNLRAKKNRQLVGQVPQTNRSNAEIKIFKNQRPPAEVAPAPSRGHPDTPALLLVAADYYWRLRSMWIELRDIHKHYGLVKANNGVNLTVSPGRIHGFWARMGPAKAP